ncbi:MAG: 2-hydroxymuconate tautomerase family protein [Thermomicrobiales bacterium]|nr:2-hydroxymuconate tautomerase family protein [Thermomicrobiales bacterium]
MPVVNVNWLAGRSPAQKQELIHEITEVVHRVGGSPRDRIAVVIQDVPAENWGRGGEQVSTLQSAPPAPPARAAVPAPATLHERAQALPYLDQQVRIFDLEQPRFQGMPVISVHQPGYAYFLHRRHSDDYRPDELGVRSSASGVIVCMEHSGTHIDAICHQADAQRLYGGVLAADVCNSKGFTEHAIEEINPMFAPGVLLDAAAAKGVAALDAGHLVTAADLQECCRRQGVEIQAGDVVLIRTGNAIYWNEPDRFLAGPGMASDASEWLAGKHVLAVGADNMAWDVIGLRDPRLGCQLPGHLILLARHGIYIIENLQLEDLAAAGYSRFTFVCLPLKFMGATGSPVRPVAIVNA